ncbi:hypothetical protein [Streptosporangium sp. NPDC051022]|uniref:hypothetical protein n=1 Tax=Streptosporangium sp. NPDC051022 TaxID=3155752 RepID=UPI00342E64AC
MQQAHPGWLIFHDSEADVWSAYRCAFPGEQEVAAGIRSLIRADSAESLDEKLTAQAEILAGLPKFESPSDVSRAFPPS